MGFNEMWGSIRRDGREPRIGGYSAIGRYYSGAEKGLTVRYIRKIWAVRMISVMSQGSGNRTARSTPRYVH